VRHHVKVRSAVAIALILSGGLFAAGNGVAQSPASDQPPPKMTTYFMGFLKKGPVWTPVTPENEAAVMEIQRGHMAHINWMGSTKKLVLAGPFLDNQDIRGILIFRTANIEEARAMAEKDPAVQAGRLVVELHPWLVQEGILPDTLESQK
jgi:uncharacterized protein YciI